MKKKIIVKISEGLGNQLFMYAHSYALSKRFDLELYIDPYSGYFKKNVYKYMLNHFNISSKIASSKWIFSNHYRHLIKKINIKFDYFKKNKSFLFETKKFDKSTSFIPLNLNNTKNEFYVDGNFETEKYFIDYKKELYDEFSLRNLNFNNNQYFKLIKNNNVVSICVRQNRYSERLNHKNLKASKSKSDIFVKETIKYIYRSIEFIRSKIDNPLFLLWSNDFKNLDEYFPKKDFIYVDNKDNKILNDFFLLTQCKYFVVAPSSFSWWGAWLSQEKSKICIRPKNLNPSNNKDFWPENWLSI